ncbi:MAG: hypothetical protein E7349_03265 [Clostridiales bacterium]|nr:hypothetical protein [Clostridiales bacterium]
MKKKFLAILLSMISVVSVSFGGCGKEEAEAPDYSDSTLQYDFYGYSAASDGTWYIDNVKYTAGEDFRTVERIKEYKNAGMTIYFPQAVAAYYGQDYETSETKKALDMAVEAGMDKVIVLDTRIQALSKPSFGTEEQIEEKIKDGTILDEAGLIGEGKQFATEAELDAKIAEYMAPYKDHEAFYGVMLGDEPFFYHATNYGEVYRSIKRVNPDCFIQYNLNPISSAMSVGLLDKLCPPLEEDEGDGMTLEEKKFFRYEKYIRMFMEATGADYIQYDQYPLKSADSVDNYYILGMQLVSKLAKEYNAEFYFVSQTYGQTDGQSNPRRLSEADLYWLNNMSVGFGIKQMSYFTYWTKSDNNTEHFIDGNSFLTWYGEKTNIYHWMKKIMAEEQKLAPTILNFDYTTSKVYMKTPTVFNSMHALRTLDTAKFTALKEVGINKEVALVTELYDDEKQNYMYMVQNVVDPANKGSKAYQTTVLTFDEEYTHVVKFVKGERSIVKLEKGGKLTLKHKPGEATYVIPY